MQNFKIYKESLNYLKIYITPIIRTLAKKCYDFRTITSWNWGIHQRPNLTYFLNWIQESNRHPKVLFCNTSIFEVHRCYLRWLSRSIWWSTALQTHREITKNKYRRQSPLHNKNQYLEHAVYIIFNGEYDSHRLQDHQKFHTSRTTIR